MKKKQSNIPTVQLRDPHEIAGTCLLSGYRPVYEKRDFTVFGIFPGNTEVLQALENFRLGASGSLLTYSLILRQVRNDILRLKNSLQ